jgi:hypothetical protein
MPMTRYLFAALLPLVACSEQRSDVLAMKIELNALKHELEYLRQQTEDLDPRVSFAEQLAQQVIDDRDAPFRLDCIGHTPGIVATRVAALTARCEEAHRTPVGYRLKLNVGNPTSAWLNGVRLTLYAGSGARAGRSERRMYYESNVALPPGGWKSVILEFEGLDDTALSELALRAQISEVALAQK